MQWRTHLISGLITGYMISGADTNALLVAGVAALLPDIDHPDSYIGSKIPIIPSLIKFTIGHRGPLHSLPAVIAFSIIITLASGPQWGIIAGAGYLAHILGDMFTLSGVPLLWPLKKEDVKIPLVETSGLLERFIVFPVLFLGFVALAGGPFIQKVADFLGGI